MWQSVFLSPFSHICPLHSHTAVSYTLQLTNPLLLLLLLLDVALKSCLQLAYVDLAVVLPAVVVVFLARGDGHTLNDLDDAVLANAVSEANLDVAVDNHASPSLPRVNINAKRLIIQKRLKLIMLRLLRLNIRLLTTIVHLIRVQRRVGDDLVLEQRFEILLALLGVEEEGVGADAETLPGGVGGREDGAADHVDVVDEVDEVGLVVGEEEGGELAGEEADFAADHGGGDEDFGDGVEVAVLAFLEGEWLANE